MGYSCSTRATHMLGVIFHLFGDEESSNTLTLKGQKYFFERGEENPDGAITGKLVRVLPGSMGQDAGNVKIEADGTIAEFPELTSQHKSEAEHLLKTADKHKLSSWSHGRI